MIKLTSIFKVSDRFGSIVEIVKTIGNDKVIVPISHKDIKIETNGEIFVNPETIKRLSWFFRKIK